MNGIVDAHTHLLPDRLAAKVRAFFDRHIDTSQFLPLDHDAVLAKLRAAGITAVWSLFEWTSLNAMVRECGCPPSAATRLFASLLGIWLAPASSSQVALKSTPERKILQN